MFLREASLTKIWKIYVTSFFSVYVAQLTFKEYGSLKMSKLDPALPHNDSSDQKNILSSLAELRERWPGKEEVPSEIIPGFLFVT